MLKGEIVGMFTGRVFLSLMARNIRTRERRRRESSEEIVVSRSADEVQEMDLQEEQRSRPVNT
jgi:hypothetical protein